MKKVLVVLLVLVMSLSMFAGCGSKNEVLNVYTEAGFPPFEYSNGSEVVGVDIDMMNAIGEKIGMEVVINNVDFSAITTSVATDKNAVGAAGLTITEERLLSVDFSDIYFTAKQAVIFKKGELESGKVLSTDVLLGKNVGIQTGTSGDFLVSDLEGANKKDYGNALLATADIGGGCDYVVIDNAVAQSIVAKNSNLEYAELDAEPEAYGIAVNKGNPELLAKINKALNELIEEGKIEEFMVKHTS